MAKQITGLKLTQSPETFLDEKTGKKIDYMSYSLYVDNRELKVKAANAETKVRLLDAFEKIAENK